MRIAFPLLLAAALVLAGAPTFAQDEPAVPNFWDLRARMERPDPDTLKPVRFMTTPDFKPFNFLDRRGALIGFNIDLARAVCHALGVACAIQYRPYATLVPALKQGEGDAVIAGLSPERVPDKEVAFTRPYLKIPARFAGRKATTFGPATAPAGFFVGVVCESSHKAYLETYFPLLNPICFPSLPQVLEEVAAGRIPVVFADALSLATWLHEGGSADCCDFVSGPYIDDEHFGRGMAIAVRADDAKLRRALDFALREVYRDGTYSELYMRYFPVGLY